MTDVENGTRFTQEYGDIDERFYSSVESALEELATLLRGEAVQNILLIALTVYSFKKTGKSKPMA